ncbi:hypothetical protein P170DRAFT_504745 [Aspergillus steynii IBT 23096]|uniref:Uncharacterized protein n=1 Tax=Aspergillus steynii IBT 23096 TaxID=1392250 RepID=A0A2I2GLT5_9EURO|nr:uncharacterized protein P170DRAFT_504745 [Aspergillus steynii IBT 23096]PLB53834.1 hypothetical protein P170DRAFT_504745 [Aspergillus steynii IBT 23096]
MSLAYPEGECFFKRSALRTSTYDPDKPEHFYAHMLVEYIWNRPAYSGAGSYYTQNVHHHPRSSYKVVRGDNWSTSYGNWSKIFFLYGKLSHNAKYRQAEHNLCVNGNRFRDQEKGGALESWFMVMPMPLLANGEEWVLIDRTACIRAIYIPIAQQASQDYPDICTFLHVNFAVEREIGLLTYSEMYDADNRSYITIHNENAYKLDATLGFPPDAGLTLAINVRKLVNLLSLPRPLRAHNCFSSHTIVMVDRKLTPTQGSAQVFSDSADLCWTTVAKANYGLSIQWQPPEPTTWLADFLRNSLTIAVGFIPVVGPIAAVAFPLAWTAVADPEAFEKTMRELIPIADLAAKVVEEINKSAKEQEQYLPKGWTAPGNAFRIPSATAQPGAGAGGGQAKPLPEVAKKDQAAKDAMVKKLEPVRNFKYWNLMKPVSMRIAAPEQAKPANEPEIPPPVAVQVVSVPEAPPKPSLDELKPSTTFQLAGQVLQHSSDAATTLGTSDGAMGETIEEVIPETAPPEAAGSNCYDWMDEYLAEEFSFPDEDQTE